MSSEVDASYESSVVVHLGVGERSDLASAYRQYSDVVLVDADPLCVERLRQLSSIDPRIRVLEAAVAGEASSGFLYRYNLPEAVSIHPATGLFELYPGLKLLEKSEIQIRSIEAVVGSIALGSAADNSIIIDIPGEELPVLRALVKAKSLLNFRHVTVYGGAIPLFEGSTPLQDIVAWLSGEGFDLVNVDDAADPDRPVARFQRNDLVLRNRALTARIRTLRSEVAQIKDELAVCAQALAESKTQSDLQQIMAAQLDEQRLAFIQELQEAKREAEGIAREREEQLMHLGLAFNEATRASEHYQAEVAELRESNSVIERLARERLEQADTVAAALATVEEIAEQRLAEINHIRCVNTAAAQLADDLYGQIEALKSARLESEELASSWQAQLEKLQISQTRAEERIIELTGDLARCDRDKRALQEHAANLESVVRSLTEENGEMSARLKNLVLHLESSDSARSELEEKFRALCDELLKTEGQIEFIRDVLGQEFNI